ncbi:MAG: phospholipase D-like domain-containing protein [Candidatus Nanoarchaeia archaeon]
MKYLLGLLLLTSCITGAFVVEETGPPVDVHFCPWEDCEKILDGYLSGSKQKDCVWYDAREVFGDHVVMDADYALPGVRVDTRKAYMHNKFCLLDSGVLTGSMNPTERGMHINYNNLIFIPSEYVKENYAVEFDELYSGIFGKGDLVDYPSIMYNGNELEVAFCPEDKCRELVLSVLEAAKEEIKFMTFSFTDKEVLEVLVRKKEEGVNIEGIMEGQRRNMKYNKYRDLVKSGIKVYAENSSATMHHKVFIVDGRIVVTGSANPTGSGYGKNDENIIVIEDVDVAGKYLEAYKRLLNDIMAP